MSTFPSSGNRLFISAVSDEFESATAAFPGLRSQLRHYLTAADCEVKVQEDFRQTTSGTVEKLDFAYIRRCAAVIHLIGEKPGAVADTGAVEDYLKAIAAESGARAFLDNDPELRAALGDFSGITYTQWEALIAIHHKVPLFVYATPTANVAQKTHLDRLLLARPKKYSSAFKDPAELYGKLIGDLRYIVPALADTIPLEGAVLPQDHWELLTQSTNRPERPTLPPSLLVAEREEAVKAMAALFDQNGKSLTLVAESPGDVDDFVSGWLQTLDPADPKRVGRRCLLVRNLEAAKALVRRDGHFVLVAHSSLELGRAENRSILDQGISRGHSWVLPVFHEPPSKNESVTHLQSPKSFSIQEALRTAGFHEPEARRLGEWGHRRLAGLLRELRGISIDPDYATWPEARLLAQACLIGEWEGNCSGDRDAIAALVGEVYESWIAKLQPIMLRPDTPLTQKDQHWRMLVRSEAWRCLARQLHDSDLEAFKTLAVTVLGEVNPELQQLANERGLKPDQRIYSGALRAGLADTLAIIGSHHQRLTQCSHGKGEVTALRVVRALLEDASAQRWATLNHRLPLLAEAAPREFIDQVSNALKDLSASPFRAVFQEENSGFMHDRNYISGLLWALESLAWSTEFLSDVVLLLGDLAEIDPGGRWSNRPSNSLWNIFLPWHYQTAASFDARLAAIKALIQERPKVGWQLLIGLLPDSHQATSGCHRPRWRDWGHEVPRRSVTTNEYWQQTNAYCAQALQNAEGNVERLIELVDKYDHFLPTHQAALRSLLVSPQITNLPEGNRLGLWEKMCQEVVRHRNFHAAEWAMKGEPLEQLEGCLAPLAPSDPKLRHRRIFDDHDHYDIVWDIDDYEGKHQQVEALREAAVREIFEKYGLDGALALAATVPTPAVIGRALAKLDMKSIDSELLPAHAAVQSASASVVIGYVWRRFGDLGLPWLDEQLARCQSDDLRARLLTIPSISDEILDRVGRLNDTAQTAFWSQAMSPWHQEDLSVQRLIDGFLQAGRPNAAIFSLYAELSRSESLNPELGLRSLEALLHVEDPMKGFDIHKFHKVLNWLQWVSGIDELRLGRIEWGFIAALGELSGGRPRTLYRCLANDPQFFVTVLSWVYRARNEPPPEGEPSPEKRQRAMSGYRLLDDWNIPPGTQADGSFDGDALLRWVDSTIEAAKACGREEVAWHCIGAVLTRTPGTTELWIHPSAASVLNRRDADEARDAFTMELFNQRGTHTWTAGRDERKLAESARQRGDALNLAGYPRFAAQMRKHAEYWEADAARDAKRDPWDRL